MTNETDWAQKLAEGRANEALETVRNTLERAVQEVGAYQLQIAGAQTHEKKAEIVNWAINYLASNIFPNLRLDQLAAAQAELKACSKL